MEPPGGPSIPVSVVLFDADGVVQSMGPVVEHLAERYGWSSDRATEFLHDYWRRETECGCLRGEAAFSDVFGALLLEWGVALDAAAVYEDLLQAAIVPDRRLLQLVEELRSTGVRCGLATNQERGRARFMAERLGYEQIFDSLFFSCEVGYTKPSAEYFLSVLNELDVAPPEVLFLDDHTANVEAARSVGLRAELVAPGSAVPALLQSHGVLR